MGVIEVEIKESLKNSKPFYDLEVGEVFQLITGHYIKASDTHAIRVHPSIGLCSIGRDTIVSLLDATLTIRQAERKTP